MVKILVSDNLAKEGVEQLRTIKDAEVTFKTGMSPQELIEVIPEYDGLVVRSATKVTTEILEAAKNLKLVGRAGIGVDNINLKAATDKGVIVMNTPFGNSITTAEHAIAMMFAAARKIPQASASTHTGKWEKKKFQGKEVYGKTLGIVGLGNIGRIVCKRAVGLSMKVIAFDPHTSNDLAKSIGAEMTGLDELLKRSDFISIHAPLNDQTRDLISTEEFEIMKDSAIIVNCARGGIINEDALAEALKANKIWSAAVDVFVEEPLPEDSKLRGIDNIVLTPHLGASTDEAQVNVAIDIANQFKDYFEDGVIANPINMLPLTQKQIGEIGEYIDLSGKLGGFASQYFEGKIQKVEVLYNGKVAKKSTKFLTQIILKNLLKDIDEDINYVNSSVVARKRGIEVTEINNDKYADFTSSIGVKIFADKPSTITGTVFGSDDVRIIKVDENRIELKPNGTILLLTNKDKPGVIGQVGSILAENQVNIARMQLVLDEENSTAFSAYNVGQKLSNELLEKLNQVEDVVSVTQISMQKALEESLKHKHPIGTRDYFGPLAKAISQAEQKTSGILETWGYSNLISPLFERLETIFPSVSPLLHDQLFKFLDPMDGNSCILRPDITPQVAHFVSANSQYLTFPLRISYHGRLVRQTDKGKIKPGQQRELFQAGFEIIGEESQEAELELISIACEMLGDNEALLELSYPSIIKKWSHYWGVENSELEKLQPVIEAKNFSLLEKLSENSKLPSNARANLLEITRSSGDPEDISTSKYENWPPEILSIIEQVVHFGRQIKSLHPKLSCVVDFSRGGPVDYYSGLCIKIFSKKDGNKIFSGGRYDNLMMRMGLQKPACGLACNLVALGHLEKLKQKPVFSFIGNTKSKIRFRKLFSNSPEQPVISSGEDKLPRIMSAGSGSWSFKTEIEEKSLSDEELILEINKIMREFK